MLKLTSALCLCILPSIAAALKDNLVAVYWGQNSNGHQASLGSYCEKSEVDIILLSFLNDFPDPLQMNFANMCSETFDSGILHCSEIGKDIKTCQTKGKKVLLSMGGGVSNYGFKSADDAKAFADVMWNKFGEGSDPQRPFDDAVVDGFDFDLEGHNSQHTDVFAHALQQVTRNSTKKFLFTSAPQCFIPDFANGKILDNVALDYIFIQFYNNWCDVGPNFNFADWVKLIALKPIKSAKLFVGLPGSVSSANSGYVDIQTVKKYVPEAMIASEAFGGFSFWDASSVYENTNDKGVTYIKEVSDYLHSKNV